MRYQKTLISALTAALVVAMLSAAGEARPAVTTAAPSAAAPSTAAPSTAALSTAALSTAALSTAALSAAATGGPGTTWPINGYPPSASDNVILRWDEALLETVRANPGSTGPTVTARALGVLHTATYDAWAAYDAVAKGTRFGSTLRRPAAERTLKNKERAISYAAYRTLVDLFPGRQSAYESLMSSRGYPVSDTSTDPATPAGVGNKAAQAVIDFRHTDGSNQQGGYAPICPPTCYQPMNTWDTVGTPWHWQPLCVPNPSPPAGAIPCPGGAVQKPAQPQWGNVTPFALVSPLQFDVPGPPKAQGGGYSTADTALALEDTKNLDDIKKAKAEYWADGPRSEFPPGHMAVFAQVVSRKRGHSLDTDAKLFFTLGNALLDSSIACWAHKYRYDFWRPITAIRYLYAGKQVNSWRGPYQGYGAVDGSRWEPYQAPNVITPPFPEYVSGHSTFSGAGGYVLSRFTGTDTFGASVTIPKGSSLFEQGVTPATGVTLSWATFTAAADEAGWSRRYGGIHFKSGDEHGRMLGSMVGRTAYSRAQDYINGWTSG